MSQPWFRESSLLHRDVLLNKSNFSKAKLRMGKRVFVLIRFDLFCVCVWGGESLCYWNRFCLGLCIREKWRRVVKELWHTLDSEMITWVSLGRQNTFSYILLINQYVLTTFILKTFTPVTSCLFSFCIWVHEIKYPWLIQAKIWFWIGFCCCLTYLK